MSAFPDSEFKVQGGVVTRELSPAQFAALANTVLVLGLFTIWPALLTLWNLRTTDALKSIGMVIPLVSAVLILRVWRTLRSEADGIWWGLALVLLATVVAWMRERAILILEVSPTGRILLRAESVDEGISADVTRQRLTGELRAFLATVRLDELTQPYGR